MPNPPNGEADATPYNEWSIAEHAEVREGTGSIPIVYPNVPIEIFTTTPGKTTVYRNMELAVVVLNEASRPQNSNTIVTPRNGYFKLRTSTKNSEELLIPFDCGWPSGWIVIWKPQPPP